MSTFYLIYEPAGDPTKFYIPDPQFTSNEHGLSQLAEHPLNNYRLIKVENYDEANPESGSMSIVPSGSETSRPPDIYRAEMSDPLPLVPKITPSTLYYSGIASPSKKEEANIRRYNLNIFNVMEFTENYGGAQSETHTYYAQELDKVKNSLASTEYTQVNDRTSREDYIIHNNRVIEYVIVYIRTMNNYKYIDTEDIKEILRNLNYIHDQLDNIYEKIGLYINKKLGRTSYDNAVIKLKVAVAYYLLAEYKDADEIFETIDLNEVPSNSLLYMYIKYYHALVKQVQLDFLESDRLMIELMGNNNDLQTYSPNMFIRCMMVRGDNALLLYNKSQALSFYEKILPIYFTAIKANNPIEQEFYDTMPEIMNNLVKSRYATVKYYVGDTKPTFAELQGIVSTFREHLPAFHPYTVDAQVILLLTNFASKPVVNQSTLIDLMERMYIINWNAYPMKFLHYMSLYSLVKPQVAVNKKINVYDMIINDYIEQITADKPEFVSNAENESVLEREITDTVVMINNKKDEIKSYFDTTNIPVKELRSQREGGFHDLPALFVFDYLKTILMNTSEPDDKTRAALKTRFQEAILNRIPEQKDSLKVAVKNPIDTTGLPDKEPYLFKGVLYEVIGGDDKELSKMARDEYLQTDIAAENVINLHNKSFDVEGTSVEVDLVTKVDNSKKSSLERLKGAFKAGKIIPDYVRITTKKGDKTTIGILRIGSTFKLPQYKDILKVDSILGGTDGRPFSGIQYIIGDTDNNDILLTPTDQETGKKWIYLSKGLPPPPTKGGTRSKRRTPLERKTRKVRSGLSVKMEE
jgi:hypothetical protein